MTTKKKFDKGDKIKITTVGLFLNEDGDPADPTTITFRVQSPDGVETTYIYGTDSEVVRDGVGDFKCYVTLDQSGDWYGRVEGTGAIVAADEVTWFVKRSQF